jgi:hypothetical protein
MRDYGQRKHVVKGGLKLKRRIIFPFGASALIVFQDYPSDTASYPFGFSRRTRFRLA